jgi:hypothetical protein
VPLRLMLCGLPGALSAILTDALLAPVDLGLKMNDRLQLAPAPPDVSCKTGGFQEGKFNYFNDLQRLRCQFIRLSIRARTRIEPFKTQAYTGRQRSRFLVAC